MHHLMKKAGQVHPFKEMVELQELIDNPEAALEEMDAEKMLA